MRTGLRIANWHRTQHELYNVICCFYRVAGTKDIGLQRQTNREERRIDERDDFSETDWLRTTDATRKEEKKVRRNNEEEY